MHRFRHVATAKKKRPVGGATEPRAYLRGIARGARRTSSCRLRQVPAALGRTTVFGRGVAADPTRPKIPAHPLDMQPRWDAL